MARSPASFSDVGHSWMRVASMSGTLLNDVCNNFRGDVNDEKGRGVPAATGGECMLAVEDAAASMAVFNMAAVGEAVTGVGVVLVNAEIII